VVECHDGDGLAMAIAERHCSIRTSDIALSPSIISFPLVEKEEGRRKKGLGLMQCSTILTPFAHLASNSTALANGEELLRFAARTTEVSPSPFAVEHSRHRRSSPKIAAYGIDWRCEGLEGGSSRSFLFLLNQVTHDWPT